MLKCNMRAGSWLNLRNHKNQNIFYKQRKVSSQPLNYNIMHYLLNQEKCKLKFGDLQTTHPCCVYLNERDGMRIYVYASFLQDAQDIFVEKSISAKTQKSLCISNNKTEALCCDQNKKLTAYSKSEIVSIICCGKHQNSYLGECQGIKNLFDDSRLTRYILLC